MTPQLVTIEIGNVDDVTIATGTQTSIYQFGEVLFAGAAVYMDNIAVTA